MIVACIPNLMDRSRFGNRVQFVADAAALAELDEEPDTIIVDLDRCDPGEVAAFRASGSATIIGFGPHIDSVGHALALADGADEVLARSVFFKRLPAILADDGVEAGDHE